LKPRTDYQKLLLYTQEVKVRTDIDAYLAGFFDGEGHISIRRDPRRAWSCYVDIGATQRDRAPLRLLVKAYGGKVIKKSFDPRCNVCYQWRCSKANDVLWALYRMLPWLIVKRRKARIALILLQNRPHVLTGGQVSHYQRCVITKALKQVDCLISINGNGRK
jgi:hypothetical protein